MSRGTTRTRRGWLARWPLSPWASARGGRCLLRPGRCGGLPLCLSAGSTCRRTPRRSHRPTPCCRPNRSTSRCRRRHPALRRGAGTRGHYEPPGPRLGRRERPRLAPRHNASQHGQRLVPLRRISRMVPLGVVQQVLGVEVGGPAVLASSPCAVTSPIQPRPRADVDRLRPTLLRGQVTAEVLQHVPNVGIGAILRRGAPLGRRLGRCFRGRPRRRGRGCRRPYRWHAWWLRQVQHSPNGKLLLHPAAPRVRASPGRPRLSTWTWRTPGATAPCSPP